MRQSWFSGRGGEEGEEREGVLVRAWWGSGRAEMSSASEQWQSGLDAPMGSVQSQ